MKYLTLTNSTLLDLIDLDDSYYDKVYEKIHINKRSTRIFDMLSKIRKITTNQTKGVNILKYLLLNMNNKIIKAQRANYSNDKLGGLYIENGSIPFERMPYSFTLKGHNTRLHDVFVSINPPGREHEILARIVKINTENNGQIYTKLE